MTSRRDRAAAARSTIRTGTAEPGVPWWNTSGTPSSGPLTRMSSTRPSGLEITVTPPILPHGRSPGSAAATRALASSLVTTPPARRVVVAAALSLLALPLAAVATPATAAGRCTVDGFSPRTVVVGLRPTRATFTPAVTGCTLEGWDLESDSFFVYDANPTEVFQPDDNALTAPQDVVAAAYDEDYALTDRTFPAAFALKRHTIWPRMDVTPEPVREKGRLTIKGTLRIADWEGQEYDAHPGQSVDVQQRDVGSETWRRFRTVRTGSGGTISTPLTATVDQCFRFVYKGSRIAGPSTSAQDCVDVR